MTGRTVSFDLITTLLVAMVVLFLGRFLVAAVPATALLVTQADIPEAEAALVLRLVFENPDYLAAGSAQGAKIAKRSGLRGITIPVHPAATRYFGAAPTSPGTPGTPAVPGTQPKG